MPHPAAGSKNHRETIINPAQIEQACPVLSEIDRNTVRKAAARQHLSDLRQRRAV